MVDYKQTLNLPHTAFAMKANLSQREPERLAQWTASDLYRKIRLARAGQPQYILHDGPPYANGDIHLGHALNKIIKDFVLKSKTLSGFDCPFVPGWDCHGLPVEINVEKKIGRVGDKITPKAFRDACRSYALSQIDKQREDFKRLGVLADWDKPYLTINKDYEANIIRSLAKIIENGHLVQGYKPVHWCLDCGSALAEAEVEYKDKQSPSIDVKFPFVDAEFLADKVACLVWTTTPWTLPSNKAVCLNPELQYAFVKVQTEQGDETWVLAQDLVESCMARYGITDYQIQKQVLGAELEHLMVKHPWLETTVPIILGDHVTVEAGTGCVHTAPAHGEDDFNVGKRYNLTVDHRVDGRGCFVGDTPLVAGMHIYKANDLIIETLKASHRLVSSTQFQHSYPHCWRHKTPIIFRATPQWFISMDQSGLRQAALKAVTSTRWMPEWGESRLSNMIESRPDWCISRQRTWTMPITSYIHRETGDLHPRTQEIMAKVADAVEQGGMEAWFDFDDKDLIGEDAGQYQKITDGLDVWFDSGVSHACVLAAHPELHFPADLYLEGSDQHRGWFHTSLLASVAMTGQAPYKQVVTHGFTVDKDGHKMSKSLGNTVAPQQVIQRLGADVLRLWAASVDFRNDQVVSDEILNRTADAYRRIRNTSRFLLANLNGFDPAIDLLPPEKMVALDRYIVRRALDLQETLLEAYDKFQFHHIYQLIHNFCSVDLGSFYLDIIKDRQYTAKIHTPAHQSAQTAMFYLIEIMVRWLAPLIPFTADELWAYIPGEREESVFLAQWFKADPSDWKEEQLTNEYWREIMRVRDEVNNCLEKARTNGSIGSGLDAQVILYADKALFERLAALKEELRFVLITSEALLKPITERSAESTLTDLEGLAVEIQVNTAHKCARCWQRRVEVGQNAAHPELCSRCVVNIEAAGEARHYA